MKNEAKKPMQILFASFEAEELALALKENLPDTFPDFSPYLGQCRFVGCSHTREKGCAVLRAVKDGEISRSRHSGYVRMFEELKDLRAWNAKTEQHQKK